jgi:quinolinate synthase
MAMNVAVQNLGGAEPLPYTPEIARATQDLYKKVSHVIPEIEWPVFAPYVDAVNKLKKQKDAVILGHNYMTPEIFNCVSDFTGDSLQLAREAARTDAKVIVQAGVHFMAETSKILSPGKTVLIPDMRAGCSLAASITGSDVRLLKQKYPGLPVVTYVNTSADVKAETDICCTSGNAVAVVEEIAREWGVDTVLMIPDKYLAQNVAKQTGVKVITWEGACEVHERFTAEEIRDYRKGNPGVVVLTHPECPPDVVAEADFSGSTSAMIGYVGKHQPKKVVLVTECSMSDNVSVEFPKVNFVKPCNLCPHMKRITLPGILRSLETMTHEVIVDPVIAERAKKAVDRMLAVKLPVQKAA